MLDKNANKPRTRYESLEDLNLISLWWQSGSDWSSIIQEEVQAATDTIVEKNYNSTSKVILFEIFISLAILVIPVSSQHSKNYQQVTKVGNSLKELLSKK